MEAFEDILRAWVDDNRGAIEEGAIGNWRTLAEALQATSPTADLGEDGGLVRELRELGYSWRMIEQPGIADLMGQAADRLILYREALEKIIDFSDSDMGDGDGARAVARAVLSRSGH